MTETIDTILTKLKWPLSHYDYAVVVGQHGGGAQTYMVTTERSIDEVFDGRYDEAQAIAGELNGIITAARRLKGMQ